MKAFAEPETLPLFLEGPVRHMKTLKNKPLADKLAVYKAVAASALHDEELKMYVAISSPEPDPEPEPEPEPEP